MLWTPTITQQVQLLHKATVRYICTSFGVAYSDMLGVGEQKKEGAGGQRRGG